MNNILLEALKEIAMGEMSYHDAIKLAYSAIKKWESKEEAGEVLKVKIKDSGSNRSIQWQDTIKTEKSPQSEDHEK